MKSNLTWHDIFVKISDFQFIIHVCVYIYIYKFFFSSLLWQWTKLWQSASPATKEHRHCQCVYTLTLVTGLYLHYFLMIYQRAICSLSCLSVMKRQDSVPHLRWRTTDKNIMPPQPNIRWRSYDYLAPAKADVCDSFKVEQYNLCPWTEINT